MIKSHVIPGVKKYMGVKVHGRQRQPFSGDVIQLRVEPGSNINETLKDYECDLAESLLCSGQAGMYGTFQAVSEKNSQRYADEATFEWNNRVKLRIDDSTRVDNAIKRALGGYLPSMHHEHRTAQACEGAAQVAGWDNLAAVAGDHEAGARGGKCCEPDV